MNEWAFAGEVKSWWDRLLPMTAAWQMSRCEIETSSEGSRKRSDIVLRSTTNAVVVAGELRLPDHDLSSPYHPENLKNAIDKATTLGADWAFTSDGCVLLLIEVRRPGRPQERIVDRVDLLPFTARAQLDDAAFLSRIQAEWERAINQIAPIIAGLSEPEGMSLDEVFIESLRALLASPVAAIREGLDAQRQADREFGEQLVVWMVDVQGWVHDPSDWPTELQRMAQIAAYVFTTRLMFYEALRRSKPELDHMTVTSTLSAAAARALFQTWFNGATAASGDYKSLFDWDQANDFALIADLAVAGWSRVLEHLAVFDLSTLGFDVVGRVFERLIEPTERYRWGQHYTQPDVVDLMLSFAVPDGAGAILDPAVGGGTFLVRAYARKAALQPQLTHQELLQELYGADVSSFAATLATINLAARRLEFEDNYPQVIARSFFRVIPGERFMSLAVGLDGSETDILLKPVTAVVCNPPYVRRQELGAQRLAEARTALGRKGTVSIPTPASVSGLSNYHVFFWLHASAFLRPGGCLAFITSGEWLDSDYGAALQEWLMQHFVIEAVIESNAEPWFSEARVGTVVLVARLCPDDEERANHLVRFVTLRQSLKLFYGLARDETELQRAATVDALRDRILELPEGHHESETMDWSVLPQRNLVELGRRVAS